MAIHSDFVCGSRNPSGKQNVSKKKSPEWILEGDIKGCFDHISHDWLIGNVQTDKVILHKWLKSGVVFNKILTPTEAGTPQGGIISPTLANITLDGMEQLVRATGKPERQKGGKVLHPRINLVRYADDFIVTARTRDMLEDVRTVITQFLAERGLTLSEEKTLITHISEGFDFLGFNIRKYGGDKLLIKPSKKSQKRLSEKLHEAIFKHKTVKQEELIRMLNPILTGWGNYFRYVVSKRVFCRMDYTLFLQLKRWIYRRHPKKSAKWRNNKYFTAHDSRNWVFGSKDGLALKKLADIRIYRHIKVRYCANPFDAQWETYFDNRRTGRTRTRKSTA